MRGTQHARRARRSTGPTNRFWLIVIGLLLVLAGAAGIGVAGGRMSELGHTVGLNLRVPDAAGSVFGAGTIQKAFAAMPSATLIGLAGLLVAVLGLCWLIFQLPRRNPTPVFGLHDDARTGLINCDAKVIAGAVQDRVEQLPGVLAADIVVRGTARHPQVSAQLEIDERSDLAEVTRTAVRRIVSDLTTSLDAEIDQIAVRVGVGSTATSSQQAVLAA